MLKVVFLLCGIVAMQFQYCVAPTPDSVASGTELEPKGDVIYIQVLKPETLGLKKDDVAAESTNALINKESDTHFIFLNKQTTIAGKDSQQATLENFPLYTVFRYLILKNDGHTYNMETSGLKLLISHRAPNGQVGITYKNVEITLYHKDGIKPLGLVGNLGAPAYQDWDVFGVAMEDNPVGTRKNNLPEFIAVALDYIKHIGDEFTSEYDQKLIGKNKLPKIKGTITAVTIRKNRGTEFYLTIEYEPFGGKQLKKGKKEPEYVEGSNDMIRKNVLFPKEKLLKVKVTNLQGIAETLPNLLPHLFGPLKKEEEIPSNVKLAQERFTSVVIRAGKAKGELNMATGKCTAYVEPEEAK